MRGLAISSRLILEPGSEVHVVDYGGVLALVPAHQDPIEAGAGMLSGETSLTQALLEEHHKEVQRDVGAEAYVLDSFAMLAYFETEVGMERIKHVLKSAEQGHSRIYLSLINLGEVVYVTERERGLPEAHAVLATVEQLL